MSDFGDLPPGTYYIPLPPEEPTPEPTQKPQWRPSASDWIAIAAVAAGVIMWQIHPIWQFSAPITLVVTTLMIVAAVRHDGSVSDRWIIGTILVGVFSIVMWPSIWNDFERTPSTPMVPQATQTSPPSHPPDDDTAFNRPLKHLSNLQLRDAAIDFASKMRAFETNTDVREPPDFNQNDTTEQKQAKWNAMIKRDEERSREKRLAFSNNYLGTADELRDEIVFRLNSIGILAPYVELSPIEMIGPEVLNGGLLAGPYPVTSAANYLEKLARRLPQL